jgi:hypothetical protein
VEEEDGITDIARRRNGEEKQRERRDDTDGDDVDREVREEFSVETAPFVPIRTVRGIVVAPARRVGLSGHQ